MQMFFFTTEMFFFLVISSVLPCDRRVVGKRRTRSRCLRLPCGQGSRCVLVIFFPRCFGDFAVKRLLFLLRRSSNGKDYCKRLLYEDKGGVAINDIVHVCPKFLCFQINCYF